MAEKSVNTRVAVLEVRQKDMDDAMKEMRKELSKLNDTCREVLTLAKLSKRFFAVILALGPTLGVILARLIPS